MAVRIRGDGLREAWQRRGFRRSLLLFSAAALVAFVGNLSFTVWATMYHEVTDGIGVIAERSCSETRRLNAGVHVFINALSTILLAGSNYSMQCLCAPTRSQIDDAHTMRRWVDIGISSLQNVIGRHRVGGRRWVTWALLGLSSLPLHLL